MSANSPCLLVFIDADNVNSTEDMDAMGRMAQDAYRFFVCGNDSGRAVDQWIDGLGHYSVPRRMIERRIVGCQPDAADDVLVQFLRKQLPRSCFRHKRLTVLLASEDRRLIERFREEAAGRAVVQAGRPVDLINSPVS